jgi:hypothetical protein
LADRIEDGRTTAFALGDVVDVRHHTESLEGDIIEAQTDSGEEIEIAPLDDGPTLESARKKIAGRGRGPMSFLARADTVENGMHLRVALCAAPLAVLVAGSFACRYSQEPDIPISNTLGMGPGPAASAPASLAGDVRSDEKKGSFDDAQAKIFLARAAKNARTCVNVVSKNQPHGDATITVTFSGAGKSTKATVGAPFDGTPIGKCMIRAFVNITITPFEGPDVQMPQRVSLK